MECTREKQEGEEESQIQLTLNKSLELCRAIVALAQQEVSKEESKHENHGHFAEAFLETPDECTLADELEKRTRGASVSNKDKHMDQPVPTSLPTSNLRGE